MAVFVLAAKNGCFYKGALYGLDENWQDGCDFNCTCEDATIGQYHCVDQYVHVHIMIMIMKNFNRRNSHGHHGSKRCKLVQHAHSHGSHAFIHTLYINTVTLTWCEVPTQLLFLGACFVFSCLCNPPNSDMDYRIFKVCT